MTTLIIIATLVAVALIVWQFEFEWIPDCKQHDWRQEPDGLRCAKCQRRPSDE